MTSATTSTTARLLNPSTYDAVEFDPATRRLFRATIDWFEAKGKAAPDRRGAHRRLVRGLHRVPRARAGVRDAADAGARRPAATPTSAGTPRATRSSTRSSASTGSPTGTRGRSRSSASARSGRATTTPPEQRAARAARGRRGLRLRPLRARPRRRHLLDRHGPRRPTATAASAPTAASTTSATATWPAWCRCSAAAPTSRAPRATSSSPPTAATRPTSWSRTSCTAQMYVSEFDLEDYPVRAEDVLHTGVDGVRGGAEHGQRRQVQPRLLRRSGCAEHCFYETITQAENRVLFGKRVTEFGQVRRILTEAYARLLATKLFGDARRRLRAQRQPRGPPLPALHPDHQDAGDDRGRADRAPARGGDLGQGLRARQLLRERQEHLDGLPKLEGTVHVNLALTLKFMPDYLFGDASRSTPPPAAPRRRRRRVPVPPGPGPRAGQDPLPRLAPGLRRASRDVPNVARFREQAEALVSAARATAPLTPEQMTADLDFQQSLGAAVHADPLRPADPRAGRSSTEHARRTSST